MPQSVAHTEDFSEHPKRILLAEDDASLRSFLAEVLRADGHEVVEASDGQRLLEHVACALSDEAGLDGIDLIVSDIRMPHFDALDVVASMRAARIEVPILLMTAFGDSGTHQKAHLLGVLEVLDKPFKVNDLRTVVCDVLFGHIVAVAAPAGESRPVA